MRVFVYQDRVLFFFLFFPGVDPIEACADTQTNSASVVMRIKPPPSLMGNNL